MVLERKGDIAENLALLRADLATHIQPEINSVDGQSRLVMMLELIDMLGAELKVEDGRTTAADAATLATAVANTPLGSITPALRARIAETAVAEERSLTGRIRSGHDSYAESAAGAQATSPTVIKPFDRAMLEAYLRSRGGELCSVTVSSLRMLPGGFSKCTYLVDIEQSGAMERWVLRRDLPFSPLRSAVPEEFPLLRALYEQGLPVAEPLWCEADPGALGAATLAVRRVAGEGDMTAWSADLDRAAAIGHNGARLIAAIHAIDPSTLPSLDTNAPGARGMTPRDQLDHLRAFWDEKRIAPNPLVELVFKWLYARIPTPRLRSLVHGDFGLHNVIVESSHIAALLDWEFAHIGDPREDLAYGRPFITKIMPWADFVESYVAAGGEAPEEAALDYYSVFGTLRNALGCFNVLHAVRHKLRNVDAKFAYVGRAYAYALLQDAARLAGVI